MMKNRYIHCSHDTLEYPFMLNKIPTIARSGGVKSPS